MNRIILTYFYFILFIFLFGCEASNASTSNIDDDRYDSNTDSNSDDDADSDGDEDRDDDGGSDGDSDGDGDTDSDGNSDNDSDGDGDKDSDEDEDAGNGNICDEQDFPIAPTTPRLMIVQDISESMLQETPSKWDIAKQAMINLLSVYASQLEFGWDVFPNNDMCGVGKPAVVDSALNNGYEIIQKMEMTTPSGATPLYCALNKFTNSDYAPIFTSPNATPYLLVVTDGGDTCGTVCNPLGGIPALPSQLSVITAGLCEKRINTFAIGFGQGVVPAHLNAIARNGCTGKKQYFIANDLEELEQVLDSIVSAMVSCVYEVKKLDEAVDSDLTNLYFDSEIIGYDENCTKGKGWSWTDHTQSKVEFCKEACEKLQNGEVHRIRATFGCPIISVK
ncbi:MAG: VWA domain-containing protein [Proteobacteria bacterium]|nr:VWA domain-containing protein [Pseudomonadota bacterium]